VATLGAFTRLADQAPAAARPLLPDRYDNLAAVRRISAPILLIHGTADEVVPYAAMQRLDQASGGRATTITLEGADHHPDMTVVAAHVDRWLAGLFGGDA
jgi:hypothetical protein